MLVHVVNLYELSREHEIYTEALGEIKSTIREKSADPDQHYRFHIYNELNPELLPSPFLTSSNADSITRFRLGSHNLPIETGRWSRIKREDRLCKSCLVLGDEKHFLFHCEDVPRNQEHVFADRLNEVWKYKDVFELFKNLSNTVAQFMLQDCLAIRLLRQHFRLLSNQHKFGLL